MFKKIVLIATASLIAFAFTGCSKKPRRPNPIDTITGPAYNSNAGIDQINPTDGFGESLPDIRPDWGGDINDLIASADRNMFSPVLFQFDSSAIAATERSKLESAANFLQSNPGAKLILEGHCDWRGTQEYNLALGDRRAKSALDYLVGMGIGSDRLKTLSQGDLQAVEGASSAQMTQERKVELLLIR